MNFFKFQCILILFACIQIQIALASCLLPEFKFRNLIWKVFWIHFWMLQNLAVLTQPLTNSHHTLLRPSENVQYCSWFRWETDRQTQKKLEAVKINYVSRKREWRTLKPSTAVAALSRLALIIRTPSVPFTVSPLLAVALKAFDMDTSAAFLTALFQFAVSGLRIDCSCFGPLNCCLERGLPTHSEKNLHQIKWKSARSREENGWSRPHSMMEGMLYSVPSCLWFVMWSPPAVTDRWLL